MNDQNRRLFFTIALCLAAAYLWNFVFPQPKHPKRAPAAAQTAADAGTPAAAPAAPAPTTTAVPRGTATARADARKVTLSSDRLAVLLTTDGAAVQSVRLLGSKYAHKTPNGSEQVELIPPGTNPLPLSVAVRDAGGGTALPPDAAYELVRSDARSAVFRAEANGVTVEKTLTLDPESFRLALSVAVRSANPLTGTLQVLATGVGKDDGSGGWFSARHIPNQAICNAGGKTERLQVGGKTPSWDGPGAATFAGINEQYFLTAVVPAAGEVASCHVEANAAGPLTAVLAVPLSGTASTKTFTVFAGPKDTDLLATVSPALKESVDFGFWSVIASFLLTVMKFFYKFVPPHNWGIAIILLTVTVKLATFPLQHKSMKSMQELQRIQPQIEELKKKYAGDTQRQQMEQMKLFKEHGVNPMGGCLPMLIQMPVWLALYTTLQVSVELYNSSFIPGWLVDLTAKDPYYILPVAMGITMLLTQVLTPQPMSNQQQKSVGYAMSLFFSFLMLNLPSGLTLYIFTNNVLSIAQQMYLRRAFPKPATA